MADSRRSSQASRQFMFIDQDADRGTSNEAIRVHVMRESHRARRQLRGLLQPSDSHGQMTILPLLTPPPPTRRRETSREPSREPSGEESAGQSPNRFGEGTRRGSRTEAVDTAELKRLAQGRLTSLITTTSTRISEATPGMQILRSLPEEIVDLCNEDVAALHALLALIATVQNSVNLLQAAQYESSALEALRSRLADTASAEHSDETITTVLLLSRLERSRTNEETAGFHEAALSRMIRGRGGLEGLAASNEALTNMLRSYNLGEDV